MLGRWLSVSLLCGLFAIIAAAPAAAREGLRKPELQDRLTKAFGLKPAEELARTAHPGFRVFMINAYGEAMPALVYTRPRSDQAQLDVHLIGGQAPPGAAAFHVTLGSAEIRQAEALIEAVRNSPEAGRREPEGFVEAEDGVGAIRMCHHPWTALIEVVDRDGVIRRERITCHDDSIYGLAYDLGDLALGKLPQCRALARENADPHEALDLCGTLAGDLSAATAVRLKVDDSRIRRWEGEKDEDLPMLLADDVRLEFPDREVTGREPVLAVLRTFEGVQFTGVVRGLSGAEVVLDGTIMRYVDTDSGEPDAFYAPVNQRWIRRGDDWLLAAMRVGPFSKGRINSRDTWTGSDH